MQSSDQRPPSAAAPAKADLARLRIERGSQAAATPRGFPWFSVLAVVVLLGLGFLLREPLLSLMGGGGGPTVRTGRAAKVVPGQAQAGDVSANGYVIADKQASLASVLSGRLVELNAAEGDTVEKGAVVARIQYDDLEVQQGQSRAARATAEARVAQAEAAVETARARALEAREDHLATKLGAAQLEADLATQREVVQAAAQHLARMDREVERNRKLFEDRQISPGEWDRIQTEARTAANDHEAARGRLAGFEAGRAAWDGQIARKEAAWEVAGKDTLAAEAAAAAARAMLAEAREAERLAEVMLEKTRIRAPFTGLVIRKDAEEGEVIAPMSAGNSRGSVVTIVDPTSLEIQVELSERRIGSVTPGDRALVFLDADPEHGLPGAVRKIWPRADRSKGSIEVRVKLDVIPADLRPDMAARVVFKGKDAPQVVEAPYVTVPREALAQRTGRMVVFVVEGDVVRRVEVARGEQRGAAVVVTSGLAGGEVVVLDPAADMQDGDRVRTRGATEGP